jgi:hypothetical protein
MRRNILLFTLLCAFLAIASQVGGVTMNADPLNEGAKYVGEKSCKKCHLKVHRGWKKQSHAKAWEQLPAKYHDPAQKDEEGRSCISCHVTGWGQGDVDGFVDAEKSAHLLGVQCEACHGPGSKHIDAAKAIMAEKRKEFNADEKTYIVSKSQACSGCHNPHVSYKKYAEGG